MRHKFTHLVCTCLPCISAMYDHPHTPSARLRAVLSDRLPQRGHPGYAHPRPKELKLSEAATTRLSVIGLIEFAHVRIRASAMGRRRRPRSKCHLRRGTYRISSLMCALSLEKIKNTLSNNRDSGERGRNRVPIAVGCEGARATSFTCFRGYTVSWIFNFI